MKELFKNDGRGGILNLSVMKGVCSIDMTPFENRREKFIKKQKNNKRRK